MGGNSTTRHSPQRVFMQQRLMVLWRRRDPHPSPRDGGSGTGSLLLHYFSTNRVDSRGLRWIPVDPTAANKRLTSNVLARISDLAPLTARVYALTRRSATISPPGRGGG